MYIKNLSYAVISIFISTYISCFATIVEVELDSEDVTKIKSILTSVDAAGAECYLQVIMDDVLLPLKYVSGRPKSTDFCVVAATQDAIKMAETYSSLDFPIEMFDVVNRKKPNLKNIADISSLISGSQAIMSHPPPYDEEQIKNLAIATKNLNKAQEKYSNSPEVIYAENWREVADGSDDPNIIGTRETIHEHSSHIRGVMNIVTGSSLDRLYEEATPNKLRTCLLTQAWGPCAEDALVLSIIQNLNIPKLLPRKIEIIGDRDPCFQCQIKLQWLAKLLADALAQTEYTGPVEVCYISSNGYASECLVAGEATHGCTRPQINTPEASGVEAHGEDEDLKKYVFIGDGNYNIVIHQSQATEV